MECSGPPWPGLIIKATVPGVRIGEMCFIEGGGERITCEVVGFRDEAVILMPLGEAQGVGPECEVVATGRPFNIRCGTPLRLIRRSNYGRAAGRRVPARPREAPRCS